MLRDARLSRMARYAAVLAVGFHTLSIGIHCAVTHRTPFTNPEEAFGASAWAIAIVYLFLDFFLKPQPTALGAVAQPIAFFCLFAGRVFGSTHDKALGLSKSDVILNSTVISLHVIALLFAFGLLALAFGCAVLYITQHRMLKQKRSGGLFGKLPPLAAIDRLGFGLVSFAFPLLTIGLVSGVIRASHAMPGGWAVDPKILLSVAMWVVYGIYLALHVLAHWRGVRANYLLIGGLVIAVATYFVPTVVHRFG
jgi:HemX protein